MRLQTGCYLCQVGDPHRRHETAEEVYGVDDKPDAEVFNDVTVPPDLSRLVRNADTALTGS